MPAPSRRTARIEARVSLGSKLETIRRAASDSGPQHDILAVAAACAAAEQTIAEVEILRLSRKASEQFSAMLINPQDDGGPGSCLQTASRADH